MPKVGKVLLLALACFGWGASPAMAAKGDGALWAFQEWWSPLGGGGAWAPSAIRVGLVERFTTRSGGLQHAVLRVGPQWVLPGAWSLGVQGFTALEQPGAGRLVPEQRLEVEARWAERFGAVGVNLRGRFEARALPTGLRDRWRLALAASHELPWGLAPFLSGEAFWEPRAGGWNQARFQVGLSGPWWGAPRLSAAYLLRPRLASGEWLWDQGLVLNWTWRGQP